MNMALTTEGLKDTLFSCRIEKKLFSLWILHLKMLLKELGMVAHATYQGKHK
jgi:hypothetical protein